MSAIANLAVSLTARVSGFINGMKRSQKQMTQTQRAVAGLKSGFLKLGGVLAGYVAFRKVAGTFSAVAGELDNVAKVSAKLGIATEHLISLRRAAELTGSSATTLDMAIQRFARRLGQAAMGSGELVKPLKELGLDAKKLYRLPLQESLGIWADRMRKLGSENLQLVHTFKAVDSEGVSLLNLFRQGSEGFAKFYAEAEQQKLLFSKEQIANIEAMNDALGDFTRGIKAGIGRTIVNWAPFAKDLTSSLKENPITAWLGQQQWLGPGIWSTGFGESASENAAREARRLADQMRAIRPPEILPDPEDLINEKEAQKATTKAAEDAARAAQQLEDSLKSSAESIRGGLLTPVEKMYDSLKELQNVRRFLGPEFFKRGWRQIVQDAVRAEQGLDRDEQQGPHYAQVSRYLGAAAQMPGFNPQQADNRTAKWEQRSLELWKLSADMLRDIRDNSAKDALVEVEPL